jgi:hypothetical protein
MVSSPYYKIQPLLEKDFEKRIMMPSLEQKKKVL